MNKKNNNKKKRENTPDHSSVTSWQEDQREIFLLLLLISERSAIVIVWMTKLRKTMIYLRISTTTTSNQLWIIRNRYYRSPRTAFNTQPLSLFLQAINKSIKDEKDWTLIFAKEQRANKSNNKTRANLEASICKTIKKQSKCHTIQYSAVFISTKNA